MRLMEADKGEHIGDFADRMIETAAETQETVIGQFNSVAFVAYPDMTRMQVVTEWADWTDEMWGSQ